MLNAALPTLHINRNICAYCGNHFHEEDLTREHIIPFAQNGIDTWMNVVTACSLSPPKYLPHDRVSECFIGGKRQKMRSRSRKRYRFGLPVPVHTAQKNSVGVKA